METILVQETDAATLEVLTLALQTEGYHVCNLSGNNENILEMIRDHHPKLVLLDCRLSHYSGRQISHWIKSHFSRLPVIALSSDNRIEDEYQLLGFDGYLKKPFGLDSLYQTVREHLHIRSKHHKMPAPALKIQ